MEDAKKEYIVLQEINRLQTRLNILSSKRFKVKKHKPHKKPIKVRDLL